MNILDFQERKKRGQKISMLTCYDYSFARILNETDIDCLLVGDSLAMTMHGFSTTLNATIEMMALHTAAVVRGAPKKFIIGDLSFCSYRKGLSASVGAAEKVMQAGAHALKLEGAEGNTLLIRHMVNSGIPVMGHLGLTPQSVHQLGGFKVQGRDEKARARIKHEAQQLQEAGCFAVVLECVPSELATEITHELEIPTIGIGAGAGTDGQVLVLQDMMGMSPDFKPKFLKSYFKGFEVFTQVFNEYHQEVREQKFPTAKESYS